MKCATVHLRQAHARGFDGALVVPNLPLLSAWCFEHELPPLCEDYPLFGWMDYVEEHKGLDTRTRGDGACQ